MCARGPGSSSLLVALAVVVGAAAGCDRLLPLSSVPVVSDAPQGMDSRAPVTDLAVDLREEFTLDLPASDGPAGDGASSDGGPTVDAGSDAPALHDAAQDAPSDGSAVDMASQIPGTWADIAGGVFNMGSAQLEACRSTGEDQHGVKLSHGFKMQHREVAQGQFEAVLGYNPSHFGPNGSGASCGTQCPVENVSWHEAAAYCNALSSRAKLASCYVCTGNQAAVSCQPSPPFAGAQIHTCPGFRLPTEAEWEFAYRAGSKTAYYNGAADGSVCSSCTLLDSNADSIGWTCANSGATTHVGGLKQANAWGLFDMAGNVWEWCHDWYTTSLGTTPVIDPTGPASGSGRVIRGGSFLSFQSTARAAARGGIDPTWPSQNRGFRCVRSTGP